MGILKQHAHPDPVRQQKKTKADATYIEDVALMELIVSSFDDAC